MLREAVRVIESREPRLLFLGTTDVPQAQLPDGMVYIPMSCQSEGALQIYVEPVVPALDLLVVGSSPMTRTLADLAGTLGWRPGSCPQPTSPRPTSTTRSIVVIASQGHGDEEAVALCGVGRSRVRRPGRVPQARRVRCSPTSPSAAYPGTSWTGSTRPSGSTSAAPATRRSR